MLEIALSSPANVLSGKEPADPSMLYFGNDPGLFIPSASLQKGKGGTVMAEGMEDQERGVLGLPRQGGAWEEGFVG